MKTTYYFSHDFNARTDKKIKLLLKDKGWTGYGLFWAIVEDLYNNANALPLDYESIAFDLRTDDVAIKSIICDYDLFQNDGKIFWSESVQRRLDERDERSIKARESANKRWNNANALQSHSKGNAIKERKGKENKGKEIKGKESDIMESHSEILKNSNLFKQPIIPTFEQVYEVFHRSGGSKDMAEKFFNKHHGTGWFLNGSPIVNFASLIPNYIATWNKNNTEKNGTKSRHQQNAESMQYLLRKGKEEYARIMAENKQSES